MTFQESLAILQSRFRKYNDAEYNVAASIMKLELNMARSKFFNDTNFTERKKVLSTVANQSTLALGSDVNKIMKIYVINGENKDPVVPISTQQLPYNSTATGIPLFYYILNDETDDGIQIEFYKIPDAIYSIQLHYKLDPDRILSDSDNMNIDDKYISGILDLALSNLIKSRLVARDLEDKYRATVMTAKGNAEGSRASTFETAFWDTALINGYGSRRGFDYRDNTWDN